MTEIGVTVEFDKKREIGEVRAGIRFDISLQLLAGTEMEISLASEIAKTKVADEIIKFAIQEMQRRVSQSKGYQINGTTYYYTTDINRGTMLTLIHPEKLVEKLQKQMEK